MANADTLASFIRGAETSMGHDDYYRGSIITPPKKPTEMTLGEVKAWQKESARRGSKSTAVGGYQFINSTLEKTQAQLGMTDDTLFDAKTQDMLGKALLAGRGWDAWANGQMSDDEFADNLAKEWAALPTASGNSHYQGDGLNAATRGREQIMEALKAAQGDTFVDLSGIKGNPSGAWITEGAMPTGEQLDGMTDTEATRNARAQRAPQFISDRERMIASREAELAGRDGILDVIGSSVSQTWLGVQAWEAFSGPEAKPDFDWMDRGFSEEEFASATEGLQPNYYGFLDSAVSMEHAMMLREQALKEQGDVERVAAMGWGGIALNIGTSMIDPVAIGVSAATEGLAAPVIYSAKLGRAARMLRAGVAAGAVNAGIETAMIAMDPARDLNASDLLYASAGGFIIGGALGGFRRTVEDQAIAQVMHSVRNDIETTGLQPARQSINAAAYEADPLLSTAGDYLSRETSAPGMAPRTALGTGRIDLAGRLKTSESPLVRRLGGLLVEDAVGNADGSVNRFAVSEQIDRQRKTRMTRFYRDYNPAFSEWRKANKKWMFSERARAEFNDAVGKAVRRPIDATTDPHVAKAAGAIKRELADLLQYGREKNVRGFNEIKDNAEYMTRQFNLKRLDDLAEKLTASRDGIAPGAGGYASIQKLVSGSLESYALKRAAQAGMPPPQLDKADLDKIAKGYVTSIRRRRFDGFDGNGALAGDQIDVLREMLQDADLDPDDIDRITSKIGKTDTSEEAGRIANAKYRLGLDETFRANINGMDVGIEDLLENDAEFLFSTYSRRVIGAAELEDGLREFKVPDQEGVLPVHSPTPAALLQQIANSGDKLNEGDMKRLDATFKILKGVPLTDPSRAAEAMRLVRDYNFIRVMGQVGVAQVAELGNILGNGGIKTMFQQMPAFRNLYTLSKNGKFKDELANEIEAIWGMGTDLARSTPGISIDDYGMAELSGLNSSKGRQANFTLQQGKQFTAMASGMSHVNMALQRMTGRVLVQKMMNMAKGGRQLSKRRMASLGISPEMMGRVSEQMKKHVTEIDGMFGRRVKAINIDTWDDADARAVFVNSVDRWSKRVIQENDIGNMPLFMTSDMGKTIGQFRSFMLAAHTKQLLAGIHARDLTTLNSWWMSMFFGGLAYLGQTHVNSIGRDDREEWLEERLSASNIGKAAFQRAGFSTFAPMAIDLTAGSVMDDPVFSFRTTELGTGIFGNPSVDLLNQAQRAASGIGKAALRDDYDWSKQDQRALTSTLPLQNAFLIRNGLAAVSGGLPSFSQ